MFTGIIEHTGNVANIKSGKDKAELSIRIVTPNKIKKGGSIAVNGVCLTVVRVKKHNIAIFDVVKETLNRTNLSVLHKGDIVNIEFPLTANRELGGHIVQGHIDGVGKIVKKYNLADSAVMEIKIPKPLSKFIVEKGSIAVDGISLTIAGVIKDTFSVALIPYTLNMTTLGVKGVGDKVNIEVDILAKYVLQLLKRYRKIIN